MSQLPLHIRIRRLLRDLTCLAAGHRLADELGQGCVPGCWYCTRCGKGGHTT